jgi:hypothetical protein
MVIRRLPTVAGVCGGTSSIGFEVQGDRRYDMGDVVGVRLIPKPGKATLTQKPDWESPLTITEMDDVGAVSRFRGGDGITMMLITKMLTITRK